MQKQRPMPTILALTFIGTIILAGTNGCEGDDEPGPPAGDVSDDQGGELPDLADTGDTADQGSDSTGLDISPGDLGDWGPEDIPEGTNVIDAWTYLIVTTDDLRPAFEELAAWRRQTGLPAHLLTMEEIAEGTAGRDSAEKLRNAIKLAFENRGARIVLLGGDTPLVPHRTVYAHALVEDIFETGDDAASELYFSDLDGDWDADGDGKFGEFEDELDIEPDVAVGRVPARTLTEAQEYVDKVIEYEQTVVQDYQQKILMVSEPTGYYGISPCSLMDLWTGQLFRADHEIHRLYDDIDLCSRGEQNTVAALMEELNEGVGMVLHLGHGSTSTLANMNQSQIASLHNDTRSNVFLSCACYSGDFAVSGGRATGETYVLNSQGGGVVYVGNTDIGIGFPSGGFFVKAVAQELVANEPPRVGEAFAYARMTFVNDGGGSWSEDHPDRYTQLVVILLGDPGIRVWQTTPRLATLAVGEAVNAGEPFTVGVSDGDSMPVPGALVTLYQPDTVLVMATTGDDGTALFQLGDTVTGEITVTASGADLVPVQATVTVQ